MAPEEQPELRPSKTDGEPVAGNPVEAKSKTGSSLLERVLARDNLMRALNQVKRNKGAPGVDGMSVEELPEYLKQYWPRIRQRIVEGCYRPRPVRRVEIPKPDGRQRKLGIPTVLGRVIQQALSQVPQSDWEPHFHDASYGFRPG